MLNIIELFTVIARGGIYVCLLSELSQGDWELQEKAYSILLKALLTDQNSMQLPLIQIPASQKSTNLGIG